MNFKTSWLVLKMISSTKLKLDGQHCNKSLGRASCTVQRNKPFSSNQYQTERLPRSLVEPDVSCANDSLIYLLLAYLFNSNKKYFFDMMDVG